MGYKDELPLEERIIRDFTDTRRNIKLYPEEIEKLRKIRDKEKLPDYRTTILFLIKIYELWRGIDL